MCVIISVVKYWFTWLIIDGIDYMNKFYILTCWVKYIYIFKKDFYDSDESIRLFKGDFFISKLKKNGIKWFLSLIICLN